ncbi:hypothetical protein Godav_000138 [Gossypium davidsonii]|uniref:Myb/SANT-like domain-containing protein n=1 Tax=Gossypium davidsonii TaxID=34287 RepID=A0A7J8TFL0_GOSDV|nr:hypothetical protein [Gossypium davidsonii]
MQCWLHVWSTCTMLEPLTQIRDSSGKDNSDFGWDEYRQLVVAEDASHKEAGQFRHCSFPYYDQLTTIYAKDRATRNA